MSRDSDTLTVICAAFPGREEEIIRAHRESQVFRDLCHDYRRCAMALHRWRQVEGPRQEPRWHEYTELLVELGREVHAWLEANRTGAPQPGGGGA